MNYILVGIIVSFVLTGISFITTQNIFLSLSIFLISTVFFVFVVNRKMKKNQLKIHRYHQCFHFINSFIISLNVKGSMSAAIQSGYETTDEDTKTLIDSIKELNEDEKIAYLSKHFKFDLYRLFVDTINLWNEEGGDILKMTSSLMEQTRQIEEYIIFSESVNKSRLIEFIVLWLLSIVIIVILRFSLDSFFGSITKQIIYQVGIMSFFLLILISIEFMTRRMTNVVIKGAENETK